MKRKLKNQLVATGLICAALIGCDSMYDQGGGVNSNPDDFLNNGQTATSRFRAIQIDPLAEDSAGPQFAAVGDFDNDDRKDVASAWNQSQPIQIHMQQRTSSGGLVFATIPIGGTSPIAQVSGLKVADLDQDGFDDIVVLVKDSGQLARCDQSREDCDVTENGGILENAVSGAIVIMFNPGNVYERTWTSVTLAQSQLAGTVAGTLPEEGGYTSLDLGDLDGTNGVDIVVALNRAEGIPATDDIINSVDFYPNPGRGIGRNPDTWPRIPIHGDIANICAVHVDDVDNDGDNDVIATYPNAKNANVRWVPNPRSFGELGNVYGLWPVHAPIGQVATNAEMIDVADIDGDGNGDVLVRSANGMIIQWFKKPDSPSQTFVRNPWQVYSIAEFTGRAPAGIALGDVTGDGKVDAMIAAGGAMAWFTPYGAVRDTTVFNFWQESLLVDDDRARGIVTDPNAAPEATGATLINSIICTDMDGDGHNDIIATLDRGTLSGLSNDALVMFRNTGG